MELFKLPDECRRKISASALALSGVCLSISGFYFAGSAAEQASAAETSAKSSFLNQDSIDDYIIKLNVGAAAGAEIMGIALLAGSTSLLAKKET